LETSSKGLVVRAKMRIEEIEKDLRSQVCGNICDGCSKPIREECYGFVCKATPEYLQHLEKLHEAVNKIARTEKAVKIIVDSEPTTSHFKLMTIYCPDCYRKSSLCGTKYLLEIWIKGKLVKTKMKQLRFEPEKIEHILPADYGEPLSFVEISKT